MALSYRGTNPDFPWNGSITDFSQTPGAKDVWNGWRLAGGYADASQAKLALSFAEKVLGITIDGSINVPKLEVDFVGHSLGGGLAGFVSSLAKVGASQTHLYDHMPFELAAYTHSLGLAFQKTCADFGLDPAAVSLSLAGTFALDNILNPLSALEDAITAAAFVASLANNMVLGLPAFVGSATHVDGEILTYLRDGTGPVLVGVGGVVASATLGGCSH